MPHGTRAFFYPYSLGTDLNEWLSLGIHWGPFIGDRLKGPVVGGQSLCAGSLGQSFDGCAPQRGGVIQPTLSFRALVFRLFMLHKDRRMRIHAHSFARQCA